MNIVNLVFLGMVCVNLFVLTMVVRSIQNQVKQIKLIVSNKETTKDDSVSQPQLLLDSYPTQPCQTIYKREMWGLGEK